MPSGPADEADAHPGPHRRRLLGELHALGFELRRDGVDPGASQPEMIEALIGRGRGRVDAVAGRHRRDEDIGAAELDVDARGALLHGADHLAAQHALEPLGGRLGVRTAQMDVVPGQFRHGGRFPLSSNPAIPFSHSDLVNRSATRRNHCEYHASRKCRHSVLGSLLRTCNSYRSARRVYNRNARRKFGRWNRRNWCETFLPLL